MAGLNGHEVARRIRRHRWGQEALLLAGADWAQSDRLRTREAGFDRHLTKHIDSERLPQLLRDFLARRPA